VLSGFTGISDVNESVSACTPLPLVYFADNCGMDGLPACALVTTMPLCSEMDSVEIIAQLFM